MSPSGRSRRFSPARADHWAVFGLACCLWAVFLIVLAAQSDTLVDFGLEDARRGTVRYLGGSAVLGALVATFFRTIRPSHFGPIRTLIATLLVTTGVIVAGVLSRNLFSATGLSSNGAQIEAVGAMVGALAGIGLSLMAGPTKQRWWRATFALLAATLATAVVGTFAIVDAGPVGRTAASCGPAYDDAQPDSGYARRFDLTRRDGNGEVGGLELDGAVSVGRSGLRFDGGQAFSSELGREMTLAAMSSDQVTVSAWIVPTDLLQQGPARILTISNGISQSNVNLHLGLIDDKVSFRVRTRCAVFNWVTTDPVLDESGQPRHLVGTYSGGLASVWIDAELVLRQDIGAGALDNWDPEFPLVLGNEASGDRPYFGDLLRASVYGYALSPDEILTIYEAGY